MGAVALSRFDEDILESLKKRLKLPSKSQVIHQALIRLQDWVERERLAAEIKGSVRKCGKADWEEYHSLAEAAFHRVTKE